VLYFQGLERNLGRPAAEAGWAGEVLRRGQAGVQNPRLAPEALGYSARCGRCIRPAGAGLDGVPAAARATRPGP